MWPFKRNSPSKDMLETMLQLERRVSRMEEEWTEVYGKFRRMQMRVAKQVQRAEQEEESLAERNGEAVGENQEGVISLTPRQQTIQQQILMRRNRLPGKAGA